MSNSFKIGYDPDSGKAKMPPNGGLVNTGSAFDILNDICDFCYTDSDCQPIKGPCEPHGGFGNPDLEDGSGCFQSVQNRQCDNFIVTRCCVNSVLVPRRPCGTYVKSTSSCRPNNYTFIDNIP